MLQRKFGIVTKKCIEAIRQTFSAPQPQISAPIKAENAIHWDEPAKDSLPTQLELEPSQSTSEGIPSIEALQAQVDDRVSESSSPTASFPNCITTLSPLFGDLSCPYHSAQNVELCPREYSWIVGKAAETGDIMATLGSKHIEQSSRGMLVSNLASVFQGWDSQQGPSTQAAGPSSNTVSGTTNFGLEL